MGFLEQRHRNRIYFYGRYSVKRITETDQIQPETEQNGPGDPVKCGTGRGEKRYEVRNQAVQEGADAVPDRGIFVRRSSNWAPGRSKKVRFPDQNRGLRCKNRWFRSVRRWFQGQSGYLCFPASVRTVQRGARLEGTRNRRGHEIESVRGERLQEGGLCRASARGCNTVSEPV